MKYLSDADEAKRIDSISSDVYMVPPEILMERAAYDIARVIMEDISKDADILAVCGRGNNGGDAICAARILYEKGFNADVYLSCGYDELSELSLLQYNIAKSSGVNFTDILDTDKYDIIIDGLFGVGLNRPISGICHTIIKEINDSKALVYAVDVPSGINATSGNVMGIAVNAYTTITFGLMKMGLMLPPGNEYTGRIHISSSAFPKKAIEDCNIRKFYYDKEDLALLPERYSDSNKGTYGRALIIAGSFGMSGAAALSAKACYRSGCGLVRILTCESNRVILQQNVPEAVISCYGDDINEYEDDIIAMLDWADSVVIGPGIGKEQRAEKLLDIVISHVTSPIVLDADALNIMAKRGTDPRELLENAIITPHLKEMSGLCGIEINGILKDMPGFAKSYAEEQLVLVLKNSRTVVSDGDRLYINASGNDGMATAGSGDVLTGIIAAFLAQGLECFTAATLGVYVHGLAGDCAAEKYGHYAMMASDIIDSLGEILK